MALRGIGAGLENLGQSVTTFSRDAMERDARVAEAEKQRTFQGLLQQQQQAGAEKLEALQQAGAEKLEALQQAGAEKRLTMEQTLLKAREQRARTDKAMEDLVALLPFPEKQAAKLRGIEFTDPITYKLLTPKVRADLLDASKRVTDNAAALSIAESVGKDLAVAAKQAQQQYNTAFSAQAALDRKIAAIPNTALKAQALQSPEYLAASDATKTALAALNAIQPKINANRELQGSLSGTDVDQSVVNTLLGRPAPGKSVGGAQATEGPMSPAVTAADAALLTQLIVVGQKLRASNNYSRDELEQHFKTSKVGKQLSSQQLKIILDQVYPSER